MDAPYCNGVGLAYRGSNGSSLGIKRDWEVGTIKVRYDGGKQLLVGVATVATLAAGGCSEPEAIPTDFDRVSFLSSDGLEVTADLYPGRSQDAATVILFHQSASSRGEYRRVAPRLQALGYNAIAVDLRWGSERNGVTNETARRANTPALMDRVEAGDESPWPVIDRSYDDMVAALNWLDGAGYTGPRVAVGSSVSAMLVYRLAEDESLAGVAAFSPGEYDNDRPSWTRERARRVEIPVLSVAAVDEAELVQPIAVEVASAGSLFDEAQAGRHGASILDEDQRNMAVLLSFLGHVTGGPPARNEVAIGTPADDSQPSEQAILADVYDAPGDSVLVVLAHQGGGSARGEYGFIIPRLLDMGYDVLTPDLQGGGDRFGYPNRTVEQTPEPGNFGYCDALPDLRTVIAYARELRPDARLVLWGSSYSGALVLHVAADDPGIDRVLAFSPADGEPMGDCGATSALGGIEVPVLAVRPESEAQIASVREGLARFEAAGHTTVIMSPGRHGSSVLNPFRVGSTVDENWAVVRDFLTRSP